MKQKGRLLMNNSLLIVGASIYGVVAAEIATDMGCFDKIDFVDDERKTTPNGIAVVGTMQDIGRLEGQYGNIIVAIGNPEVRVSLLKRIKEETSFRIATLISPKAYISPSAKVMSGCIIEPMALVHTNCLVLDGCIISAGAVVNHASVCCKGVHVDCNATVEGYCFVPSNTKICSGEAYKRENASGLGKSYFDPQKWAERLYTVLKLSNDEIEDIERVFDIEM